MKAKVKEMKVRKKQKKRRNRDELIAFDRIIEMRIKKGVKIVDGKIVEIKPW